MSIRYTWERAIGESELKTTTRCMLLTMATFLNRQGGGCFPSQEILAKMCGTSVPTIKRSVREAKDAGFLRVERQVTNGIKRGNIYHPTFPNDPSSDHPRSVDASPVIRPEGITHDPSITDQLSDQQLTEREEADTTPPPSSPKHFRPPTNAELKDFVIEFIQTNVDEFAGKGWTEPNINAFCAYFMDFYASKGWMVGKSKMKNWQAAARRGVRGGWGMHQGEKQRKSAFQRAVESINGAM